MLYKYNLANADLVDAHAQPGLPVSVGVSVLCVYAYFRPTGNEANVERYQRLQCYKRSKNKMAIFSETAALELVVSLTNYLAQRVPHA